MTAQNTHHKMAALLPKDVIALLRHRAQWYAEGCPFLEDLQGYLADGIAADASSDLNTAVNEIERLTERRDACQSENSRLAEAKQRAEAELQRAQQVVALLTREVEKNGPLAHDLMVALSRADTVEATVRTMRAVVAAASDHERGCPVVSVWMVQQWIDALSPRT